MFVYRNKDLPPDPEYPADLKKLGYFINDNDQIRQITNPEEGYKYRINRNERFNIKQREAMNEVIRGIVIQRLQEAGLKIMRLPFHDTCPPRESYPIEPHVPILVSPNLNQAPRIIVVFGEPVQDLGIWAYRAIGEEGINIGSTVNFTKAVLGEGSDKERTDSDGTRTDTALVLANTGQLIWHCAKSRAITNQTWLASPRPAGNWGQTTMSHRNRIPANGDWREHVQYVFEEVVWKNLGDTTRVDVIGMSEGGLSAIKFLKERWDVWRHYISGICLGNPLQSTGVELDKGSLPDPESFTAFISSRCRGYLLSDDEADTPQSGYRTYGHNCYSSGEALNSECNLVSAWPHMLAWLDMLYKDRDYAEQVMVMENDMDENMHQAMDGLAVQTDERVEEQQEGVKEEGPKVVINEKDEKEESTANMKQEVVRGDEIKPDPKEDAKEDVKEESEVEVKQEENGEDDIQAIPKEDEKEENTVEVKQEVSEDDIKLIPKEEDVKFEDAKEKIYESDEGYSGDVEEMETSIMGFYQ